MRRVLASSDQFTSDRWCRQGPKTSEERSHMQSGNMHVKSLQKGVERTNGLRFSHSHDTPHPIARSSRNLCQVTTCQVTTAGGREGGGPLGACWWRAHPMTRSLAPISAFVVFCPSADDIGSRDRLFSPTVGRPSRRSAAFGVGMAMSAVEGSLLVVDERVRILGAVGSICPEAARVAGSAGCSAAGSALPGWNIQLPGA